jgi:hypothetical protein
MIGNSLGGERLPRAADLYRFVHMSNRPRPENARSPNRGASRRAASSMRAAVKSLLLVVSAGLLLALGSAPAASAAKPCWKALINDWYDGKIDKTYPRSCYTKAINHLPQDVSQYSAAKDDIEAALLASIRHGKSKPPSGPGTGASERHPAAATPAPHREGSDRGVILKAIEWLGPSNAASVPLPLLILAAVAFLLLAAAGGTFVNRWLQERRLPPNPGA